MKKTFLDKIYGKANYFVRNRCSRILNFIGVPGFVENYEAPLVYGVPFRIQSRGIFTEITVSGGSQATNMIVRFDRLNGKHCGTGFICVDTPPVVRPIEKPVSHLHCTAQIQNT
jgi:hypothetical protein